MTMHTLAGTIELSNAGLNWGTVLAFFVAIASGAAWLAKRADKNRKAMQDFVGGQVSNVATILDVKLSGITRHLEDQDAKLGDTRDRVIRLEGKINGQ